MRKKTFHLLLWALPMLLGLASCAEKDNPVDPNPLAKQVSGLWWSLTEQEGTYSDAADSYPYTRIGQAIYFNEEGAGYGVTFFFNDEQNAPIAIVGGESMAPFTYTSKADGRLSLNFENAYKEYADYFKQWTMTYANATVSATNGSLDLTLEKANDAIAAKIHEWDMQFNGGAEAEDYNINNYAIKLPTGTAQPFTRNNWREQGGIFLYVGGTGETTIQDTYGRGGYQKVNLPWADATTQRNLKKTFFDDLTADYGWQLVMNQCGNRSTINGNYFAIYNKYTGILRFFYYMPSEYRAGNDFVWEVALTDNLGQHTNWFYGIPSSCTIKDKAAIGQNIAEYYVMNVSPWSFNLSPEGYTVPNEGWWAFDVDLSAYRPNTDFSSDEIRLQMRTWDTDHTSLYSTVTANIDGTIKGTLQQVGQSASTAQGVLMGLTAAAQAGSAIASFYSGNWAGGLSSIGSLMGTGTQMAATFGGNKASTTNLSGYISLGLKGNIDTKGVISGSKPSVLVSSPSIPMKKFDTEHTTLGQGVWNIKNHPVVYRLRNQKMLWNGKYSGMGLVTPYFFDPNSVEVELNSDVFPESDIEWMEVDAICGARSEMQAYWNPNDAYRRALGLNTNDYNDALNSYNSRIDKWGYHDVLWDFLYDSNDKYGLEELHKIYTANSNGLLEQYIAGRGINGYAIEPQWRAEMKIVIPFVEVNVKVKIKMKGMEQPIVLSRNYLPEMKTYNAVNLYQSSTKVKAYASKMKGHTDLYDFQMKRIQNILSRYGQTYYPEGTDAKKVFIPTNGSKPYVEEENWNMMFDSDNSTKFTTNDKQNGVWFIEFNTLKPIIPVKYYMTTAEDAYSWRGRNPKTWKLYGKLREGDSWTVIDNVQDGAFPISSNATKTFNVGTPKQCQYFRLEISQKDGSRDDILCIAEFGFSETCDAVSPATMTSEHLGWVYCNDGYIYPSAEYAKRYNASAVGIVAYVNDGSAFGDAATEKASGAGHGLAIAMDQVCEPRYKSATYRISKGSGTFASTIGNSMTNAKNDFDGLAKTKHLKEVGTEAANILSYMGAAPTGGTDWFIPSTGQWIAMLCKPGLGGAEMPTGTALNTPFNINGAEKLSSKASANGGKGMYGKTWTSSGFNGSTGIYLVNGGNPRFTWYNSSQAAYIRAAFAF